MNSMNINNLQLLGCKVLIKAIEDEKKSFVIPASKDKPSLGQIVLVGDGKDKDKTYDTACKIGDKVIFKKWAGHNLTIDNQEYIQINWSDVDYIVRGN